MGEYLNKTYYVINTPVIQDTTPNSNDSIYKYNVSSSGSILMNDICMNAYIVNGEKKNTVYYDDIVFYKPINTSTDSVYLYQGINRVTGAYSFSTFNNIYELSNYISKRLLILITELQLANECKRLNTTNQLTQKPQCSVFNPVSYNLNIPLFQSVNGDLEVVSGTTVKQKQIIQESNDINRLISRFNEILTIMQSIPNTVNYTELINQQKRNEYLRNELDRKLREIYEYRNTNIVQSQIDLDNTVYTGVLWSILATSLAYFVFIKL
jgi:hypothetical protein